MAVPFNPDFPSCSANPAYHELLLTVLWYGVVHTSALVRCTAARMFEVRTQGSAGSGYGGGLWKREKGEFKLKRLRMLCCVDAYLMVLNSV